jgi:hypothetical protein
MLRLKAGESPTSREVIIVDVEDAKGAVDSRTDKRKERALVVVLAVLVGMTVLCQFCLSENHGYQVLHARDFARPTVSEGFVEPNAAL